MFEKYIKKLEEKIVHISGRNFKPELFSFEWFLILVSNIYERVIRFRIWLYARGFLKQKRLPCFVISVGNIVAGGAGKTPMAIYIAELLKKMGKRVVVISRGYRGNYKEDALIVSDGRQIFVDDKTSGDEAYMMAKRKSFPVVVGKNRFKAGMKAINAFNPDVIILDDGFQHLKLKRDLDFLLLDYSNPLGNGRLLPAGRLRETPDLSVKRADILIFTRSLDTDEKNEMIQPILQQYPGYGWFKSFHRPFVFKQIDTDGNTKRIINNPDHLKGQRALLFSGIAENRSFYDVMVKSGIIILDHLEFKDHYRYKESDILRISREAERLNAEVILTTEKDWAKLDENINWDFNIVVIGIRIAFAHPQKLKSLLNSRLKTQ